MYNVIHNQNMAKLLADRSLPQVIIETSLFAFIALTAFVGNACVLWVFYKSKELRKKVSYYYLITLAISDVIASITASVVIATAATGCDVIGFIGGQVFGIISFTLIYGTVLTTSMIAVNRFFCVVKQQLYRKWFKPKPALIMIVIMWIISFLTVTLAYIDKTIVFRFYPGRFCYYPAFLNYTSEKVAGVVSNLSTGILPLFLIMFCNYKIKKTVQVHSNSLQNSAANNGNGLPAEEIRITKSLIALMLGFTVCWTTGSILVHIDIYTNLPRGLEMVLMYGALLSSAINPFIYNIFNRRFRNEFLRVFCSRNRFIRCYPKKARSHYVNAS